MTSIQLIAFARFFSAATCAASKRVRHETAQLNGEGLFDAQRRHRLSPLAYWCGCDELQPDFVQAALFAELREQLLAEATRAILNRNINVALLKGVSYVGTLYTDPALRPMTDIDLLVPSERHPQAVKALVQIGYQPRKGHHNGTLHHAVTLDRGDSTIDLHRSIIQPLRNQLNIEEMWQRAKPAAERTDGTRRLDPIDETLIHLVHMVRHEFHVALITYIDAALLLDRLSEEQHQRLLEQAKRSRLERAVNTAIAITMAFRNGVTLPFSTFNRLMPSFAELAKFKPVPRPLQLLRKAALLEGPREVVGLAAVNVAKRWNQILSRLS